MTLWRAWAQPIPIVILALLSSAIGFGAHNLFFDQQVAVSDGEHWPIHLKTRIELKATETFREVKYYPDGFNRKHAQAIESGGETTQYWYRPDGTMRRAQTSFLNSEHGILGFKRIAVIAQDGKTYVSDLELSEDGKTLRKVDLVNPTQTVRRFNYPSGNRKQEEIFVLDRADWVKQEQSAWYESGQIKETLKLGRNGSYSKQSYNPIGLLASTFDLNEYSLRYQRKDYAEDGKSLVREILQETSTTSMKTYHSGVLKEEWIWHGPVNYSSSMVKIRRFDPNGSITQEQYFMPADGALKPYSVTIFKFGQPTLQFTFSTFGERKISTFTEYHSDLGDKGPYTYYTIRPNGSIESEMSVDKPGTPGIRKAYGSGPNDTVFFTRTIKPEWIKFTPVPLPEQVVKYHPPYPH